MVLGLITKGRFNMKTRVGHCKKEVCDIYIGRPMRDFPQGSIWGNKFVIGVDGTREEVILKYEAWLINQPHLMAQLESLRGKLLGCWCRVSTDKSRKCGCHGDVLVRLLEGPDEQEPKQISLF